MLLPRDEQDLLDYIKEQIEPDTIKGLVDLKDSRFSDYAPSEGEALFEKLKKSGFITNYRCIDALMYQVEMHPDFLIEPV